MRKWLPLLAICLGTFMLLVDVTIVNVALPSMVTGLDTSFTALQWVIDGYALALAALLQIAGSAADRFGRRLTYVIGLVVFAAASLACGLAPTSGALVASRLAQGIGGAAMFAATTALLQSTYTGRDRGTAFGVWGAVSGASAAAGPVLGGLLTEAFSWRAVFLVNLPVALATVLLTLRVVPETRHPHRIDALGGLTFTVAIGGAVYALVEGGERGWSSSVPPFAVALVALALFVAVEIRTAAPLLDLALFRRPAFVVLMVTAVVMQASAFGHLAYVSLWLQSVLSLSPLRAGLVALPLSLAAFAVSAGVGRLLHGASPRLPVGLGMLLIGAGGLLGLLIGPGSSWPVLLPALVVIGLGVGLGTPVLVSAALATVPPQRAGMAGGAVNTFRQFGLAMGVAVLGTLFSHRVSAVAGDDRPAWALAGPVAHQAFAAGLDRIFLVAGASGLLCGAVVLLMPLAPPLPSVPSVPPVPPVSPVPVNRPAA